MLGILRIKNVFRKMSTVVYRKKTSTTYAPGGGLSESRSREWDGAHGTESVAVRRTLGDRHVEVTTYRGAPGPATVTGDVDPDAFDAEWTAEAQRRMPEYCRRGAPQQQLGWH